MADEKRPGSTIAIGNRLLMRIVTSPVREPEQVLHN
jgi:hypothetical protein